VVHKKSFFVLSRGLNGVSNDAMVWVLVDSWFTRPIKDRKSDLLVGVGYLVVASVMDGSTLYPLDDS